jgi:hypothetical protein
MKSLATVLYGSLLALPVFAGAASADTGKPPAELDRFVARGESLLAFEQADLNGDGLRDVVFIVEPVQANDDAAEDDGGTRTLRIAIRAPDGSLKIVKESSRVALCRRCGGAFGDPFAGLSASKNTFSVGHYGGSGWRWSTEYTFHYSRRDATWQLVQVDESSFHVSDPEKLEAKTYRPPRHFGKIDIADFDPEHFKGVGPK